MAQIWSLAQELSQAVGAAKKKKKKKNFSEELSLFLEDMEIRWLLGSTDIL